MGEGHKYYTAVAALDAIYRDLPTLACQGRCAAACGPVTMTDVEARRLQVTSHRKPRTIPVTVVDASGNTLRERCVYLTPTDRCSVYAVRPLICRAWGLVKMLSCMHGCVPSRWLTDREFLRIAQAVERLGGGRCLITNPDGLARNPSGNFTDVNVNAGRPDEEVADNAERTRSLRALHGGRILLAIQRRDQGDNTR